MTIKVLCWCCESYDTVADCCCSWDSRQRGWSVRAAKSHTTDHFTRFCHAVLETAGRSRTFGHPGVHSSMERSWQCKVWLTVSNVFCVIILLFLALMLFNLKVVEFLSLTVSESVVYSDRFINVNLLLYSQYCIVTILNLSDKISKYTEASSFPSMLWHCWLADRKGIQSVKIWVLVCWWWHFDWKFARLIVPVVPTISITLSSSKVENGDTLVPA